MLMDHKRARQADTRRRRQLARSAFCDRASSRSQSTTANHRLVSHRPSDHRLNVFSPSTITLVHRRRYSFMKNPGTFLKKSAKYFLWPKISLIILGLDLACKKAYREPYGKKPM